MRHGAAAFACLLGSCASPSPQVRAPETVALSASTSAAASRPTTAIVVQVVVRAPVHARSAAPDLGSPRPSLGVVVTNRSALPVDVTNLRVHLAAVREGASFRCAALVGPPAGAREPANLAPGTSYVFERDLDCALPLVGAYAVRVDVSFGKGDWMRPREVRSSTLTVTALPSVAPRELEGVPGLWASIGASGTLAPSAGQTHGRTVLALVNATAQPIEVPRMYLVLRVYRAGNPIPCEDEPTVLATPSVLGAADTYYEPIVVSCLGLAVPGTYDVAAHLVVPRGDEGAREVALGRLRVEVVTNPSERGGEPR